MIKSSLKFADIKVGDTVYCRQEINYGWRLAMHFFLPFKVSRFTLEGLGDRQFNKKDGCEYGKDFSCVYKLGDEFWSDLVSDQSAECLKVIKNLEIYRKLDEKYKELTVKVPVPKRLALDPDRIGKITILMDELISECGG